MGAIFKTSFRFKLQEVFYCKKTKRRRAKDRGLAKIRSELDVANFIRFHLTTRSLIKQLFTAEKMKAARDHKSHLESDQSPASDESSNIEPDSINEEVKAAPNKNNKVTPI